MPAAARRQGATHRLRGERIGARRNSSIMGQHTTKGMHTMNQSGLNLGSIIRNVIRVVIVNWIIRKLTRR